MFLARTPAPDGRPRLLATDDPASGWRDIADHYMLGLVRQGATTSAAIRVAAEVVGGSLTRALEHGDLFLDQARGCAESHAGDLDQLHPERFLCPVDPPVYRDFMVFEEHFSFGYRWRGLETPEVMYEMPVSYLGNPASFVGSGDEIPWPHYAEEIDYELELGIVLSRPAAGLTPDTARGSILGLTILNDVSARDIQRREMTAGLGPSKGKHFASAAGPWIATLDELDDDLAMRAVVNGETRCETHSAEMIWSLEEIVAWASAAEVIPAGSLLGTGTANGGSGVEFGQFLEAGDRVALSVDGLGTLENTLGARGSGWVPDRRTPAKR
ncbi:fumarylacetoacetate hydrolase family protein [Nocardioides sp. J54]|uniref:fumarylacetoacetate hydrolase family protein n=1 Tax=Nocardioides sp. J54 TaxID=935866 RepID=UPI0004B00D7B|nr:fumarylacetoacetate hydrolase family protein [Nocardioides sp. J54]